MIVRAIRATALAARDTWKPVRSVFNAGRVWLDWAEAQAEHHEGPDYNLDGRRWPVDPPVGLLEGPGHLCLPWSKT